MTDYSDFEDWVDDAAFDIMRAIRDTDWVFSRKDRDAFVRMLNRITELRIQLEDYVPESYIKDP